MAEYIRFTKDDWSITGKTRVVTVLAVRDNARLGEIKWFGRWRQYAFFPFVGTIWNPECLEAVNAMIRELMDERKQNANAANPS